MQDARPVLLLASLISLGGCVPERDNANDPAVRPSAAIEAILVDGADTGGIGSRGAVWTLVSDTSGRGSGFTWCIALSDGSACESVGTGPTLTSAEGSTLQSYLAQVRDFAGGPEPGTGLARRVVRLTVTANGITDVDEREVFVLNQRSNIDLGPDLRIAPGGRWWTLDPGVAGTDILDAPPMPIELHGRVQDSDPGDESLPLSATFPGRWRVVGQLAVTLDADDDGFVDAGFVDDEADRPGGRSVLRFDAPLVPGRSVVTLEAGDVVDDTGAPVYNAGASIDVDVLSSLWVRDVGVGAAVTRIDVGTVRTPWDPGSGGLALKILARAGDLLLVGETDGPTSPTRFDLVVLDSTLRERARRVNALPAASAAGAMNRIAGSEDGAGGWWLLDEDAGTLRHLDASLTPDSPRTGFFGNPFSLVRGPGTEVWVTGGAANKDFFPTTVSRVPVSGASTASISLSGEMFRTLTADGAGGLWLSVGNPEEIRRHDASGAASIGNQSIGFLASRLFFDDTAGDLWIVGSELSSVDHVLHQHYAPGATTPDASSDTVLAIADSSNYSGVEAVLDRIDGVVLIADPAFGGFFRVSPGGVTGYLPLQVADGRSFHLLDGGSLIASEGQNLVRVEAALVEPDVSVSLPPSFDPGADPAGAAIDPASGALWLFRAIDGSLASFSSDGEPLSEVTVVGSSATTALAIDADSRTLWLAWATADGGLLETWQLPVNASEEPVPLAQIPISVDRIDTLSVAGGRACVGGSKDALPDRHAVACTCTSAGCSCTEPTDFEYLQTSDVALASIRAIPGDECWFLEQNLGGSIVASVVDRMDATGLFTPYDVDPDCDGNLCWGLAWDFWGQRALTTKRETFSATGDIVRAFDGSAMSAFPLAFVPATPGDFSRNGLGIAVAPFSRELFLTFDSDVPEAGRLMRFDAGAREVSQRDFSRPRLASP